MRWVCRVVYLVSGAVLCAGLGCEGRSVAVPTVGVLQYTANNLATLEGFRDGMAERGYREGETIRYRFDGPVVRMDDLEPRARQLVAAGVDLLFTSPTPATLAAKRATSPGGPPIVFAPVNDPLAAGVVSDLRRPGGTVTGVRLSASDGRRLQWLRELVPDLRVVYVPYNPNDKSALRTLQAIKPWADRLALTLLADPLPDAPALARALGTVPATAEAIFLPRDGLVMSHIAQFVQLSLQRKLPLSTPRLSQVEQGALVGYGFIGYELGQQAARLADQILRGVPAGDLPVETAEDYLFLNLASARAIGLAIDDSLLRQAHTVVR